MRSSSISSPTTATPPPGDYAETINPEIAALAASLGNDPVKIFAFVYENIAYEHYYGCKKGAQLTFLEGSGNDMDQAALLVALLRAAGLTADYKLGYKQVAYQPGTAAYDGHPIDTPTAIDWLGLDPLPYPGVTSPDTPDGWTPERYNKIVNLIQYFSTPGFPYGVINTIPDVVMVSHMTVRLDGGTPIYLDPSTKRVSRMAPLNILAITGFDAAALMATVGGDTQTTLINGETVTYSATHVNSDIIREKMADGTTALLDYLKSNRSGATITDILGKPTISPYTFSTLANADPLLDYGPALDTFQNIPRILMSRLVIRLDSAPAVTLYFPQMAGAPLSVAQESGQAVLRLGDQELASTTSSASTYTLGQFE